MRDSAMVAILKANGFGGADLSIISKIKRPEYYGVQLTMEARQVIGSQYTYLKKIRNQAERMIAYMDKVGSISSLEAMSILGILSPTKRMSEIRRMPGIIVHQKWESDGKSRWLRYWIERVEE